MCTNFYLLIVTLLLSNEVFCKNGINTKNLNNIHKKHDNKNGNKVNERSKRSLTEIEKAFLTHIIQGLENENLDGLAKYTSEEFVSNEEQNNLEKELPFWGTRGKRDVLSENTGLISDEDKQVKRKFCDKYFRDFHKNVIKEEPDPFWFERGVKDKSKEYNLFWDNRRRRDEIEPFWGNRGRRDEMEPFWGNRGRRDEVHPFWANRGRRDELDPFWGNRGRRQETDQFWGTRGRRETKNPLRGNPSYSNQSRKKTTLKDSIISAVNNIKHGTKNLARVRRSVRNFFWNNRGRDSKQENFFKQQGRNKTPLLLDSLMPDKFGDKETVHNTVLDERMYAEQPYYILIDRSSRSSTEDDPFFISRGKKYTNSKLLNGFRDRRGVLEELVKSVRSDPYYIARGKKDSDNILIGNSTISKDKLVKAKELICSAIDLLAIKNYNYKIKRDLDESERERRTILKNLAAQIQIDPYFVSRGKKNNDNDINEYLEDFIDQVNDMCN